MTILKTAVRLPDGRLVRFVARVHLSVGRDERRIEQVFYDEWAKGGFDGPHVELEVIEPELWKEPNAPQFHFHTSQKTGQHFVCWINHVPDESRARTLLDCWALATAYRMMTGDECPALHDGRFEEYIVTMRTDHLLLIASDE